VAGLYRDNRTFFGIDDDTWIALAIWSILCYWGYLNTVNGVVNTIIGKQVSWDTVVIVLVSSIFIALGSMAAVKRMERRVFLLILAIAFLWVISFIINEDARALLRRYYFVSVMVRGLAGILCIGHFNNWKRLAQVGKFIIIPGIILFYILTVFVINGSSQQLYLTFSYNNLIFVVGAFWLAIRGKNKIMWVFASVGMVFLIVIGSRGAVLCAITYVVLEFLLNKKIHFALKILFFVTVVLLFLNLENIVTQIDNILSGYGYESRTINMFFEGTLQENSGRSDFYSASVEVIKKFAVFGCGMGGSSFHLFEQIYGIQPRLPQPKYSHSLILDFLMEYGVVFGLILLLWILISIITAYVKGRKNGGDGVLFLLLSISICKLMFSSTYLAESQFFILLGLLVNLNCYTNNRPWENLGGGDR